MLVSPSSNPPGLQPVSHGRRSRSMSICVPPSSYSFSHAPSSLVVPPKQHTSPPPDLFSHTSTTSPCVPLAAERDTFAGRLSKALETVLPLHSASSQPRARQRRASLPALFSTPVGFTNVIPSDGETRGGEREKDKEALPQGKFTFKIMKLFHESCIWNNKGQLNTSKLCCFY